MKKSLLAFGFGISMMLVGCGSQPDIDIADENQTEQNQSAVVTPDNSVVAPENNVSVVNVNPQEQNLSTENTNVVTETVIADTDEVNTTQTQNLSASLAGEIVYFDFDKFDIRDDMINTLSEVGNILKDNTQNYTVRIEGNCDEWGSDEYNYALGLKRAKAVKSYLISLGVDANKLTIISYGESNPVCTAHTKECWQKNRRVNFTILP